MSNYSELAQKLLTLGKLKDIGLDEDDLEPSSLKQLAKIGRNDPCPCGSGKKFKKMLFTLIHR